MATLRQSLAAQTSSGLTLALQFGVNVLQGSLLVCYPGSDITGRTFTVSDNLNAGNYTADVTLVSSGGIFTFPNTIAGSGSPSTITAAISGAATRFAMIIEEWTGVATVNPADKHAENHSSAVASSGSTGTTATLSAANELVLALMVLNSTGGPAFGPSSPFTAPNSSPVNESGGGFILAVGNNQPTSTAAISATFTWNQNQNFRGCISTYQTAAAPAVFLPFSSTQFFVQDRLVVS